MKNITNYVIGDLDLKFEAKSSKEMKDPFDKITGNSSVQQANKAAKELEEIAVNAKDVNPKSVTYSRSGSKDEWNVDPPYPNWEKEFSTTMFKNSDKNTKKLVRKFLAAKKSNNKNGNFYVVGERGWAKTTTIMEVAKRFGYHIVVVYLDKAEPEDLGGMPVVIENKDGSTETKYNLPPWAKHIYKNPKKKFLLFFDEMNQATGGVTNALMPIVLEHVICGIKFDNILVGAAGNRSDENSNVSDIEQDNKPLASRFKPIIYWETSTDDAWDSVFDYLYKQWGDKYSLILDKLKSVKTYWSNPRELDQKLFDEFIDTAMEDPEMYDDESEIKDQLMSFLSDSLNVNASVTTNIDKITRFIYNFIQNEGKVDKDGNPLNQKLKLEGKRKGTDFDDTEQTLIIMLKNGYYINDKEEEFQVDDKIINGDGKKYYVTLENIFDEILPPWALTNVIDDENKYLNEYGEPKDEEAEKEFTKFLKENKEQIFKFAKERLNEIVRYIEADNGEVKFETNADAREYNNTHEKDQYGDPAEWNKRIKQKSFFSFITLPAIMTNWKHHKEVEQKPKSKSRKSNFDEK